MKWKWRNDRRSEHNLCNCVKKPEKSQDFNGVWTHDLAITGAMLSRSIVGSYVPVKEMSVNDIWNKSWHFLAIRHSTSFIILRNLETFESSL